MTTAKLERVETLYEGWGRLLKVTASLPDGSQTLRGDGWDFGWTAGVQLHNKLVTVGISYKSSIKHTLKLLRDLYAKRLQIRVSYGGKSCYRVHEHECCFPVIPGINHNIAWEQNPEVYFSAYCIQ